MKVLLVIHGYPPRYNAGSEVYTQTLAYGLKQHGIDVTVFVREEDPFLPDFQLRKETDQLRSDIPVYLVNHPRSNARFRNHHIEQVFLQVLEDIRPDIVHFGHLNHLSTGLIQIAHEHGTRIVFTLHDFWLICPRGQFLQWGLTKELPWKLCPGQDDSECAERCFNRFVTGLGGNMGTVYWTQWVRERMDHVRKMSGLVDLFLAPSMNLMHRHIHEFGINEDRIRFLDYGFDHTRLKGRKRIQEKPFVFGYIGRHHPSKGIDHLIKAFSGLDGNLLLRIWGRTEGQLTQSLKRITGELEIDKNSIEWLPEYRNEDIIHDVFNRCDCIVVPSIWDENSPLVIHEAQQAGVPVITSGHGGMGEYVKHGVNGLTFVHRDVEDLRKIMQYAVNNQEEMIRLGNRGYLHSTDGLTPSIDLHVTEVLRYYSLISESGANE